MTLRFIPLAALSLALPLSACGDSGESTVALNKAAAVCRSVLATSDDDGDMEGDFNTIHSGTVDAATAAVENARWKPLAEALTAMDEGIREGFDLVNEALVDGSFDEEVDASIDEVAKRTDSAREDFADECEEVADAGADINQDALEQFRKNIGKFG